VGGQGITLSHSTIATVVIATIAINSSPSVHLSVHHSIILSPREKHMTLKYPDCSATFDTEAQELTHVLEYHQSSCIVKFPSGEKKLHLGRTKCRQEQVFIKVTDADRLYLAAHHMVLVN